MKGDKGFVVNALWRGLNKMIELQYCGSCWHIEKWTDIQMHCPDCGEVLSCGATLDSITYEINICKDAPETIRQVIKQLADIQGLCHVDTVKVIP